MTEFPTITHVALTVSDLTRSVPWYEALFDAKPVLDEDTGPFRHVVWLVGGTLVGLHQFPDLVERGTLQRASDRARSPRVCVREPWRTRASGSLA